MSDDKYQPDYADPNEYARMKIRRRDYEAFEGQVFIAYLRKYGILTREQFSESVKKLEEWSKERESSWIQKIGSAIYYAIRPKITPKGFAWALTHLDKITPYVTNKTLKDILNIIDKLATHVYEQWSD